MKEKEQTLKFQLLQYDNLPIFSFFKKKLLQTENL